MDAQISLIPKSELKTFKSACYGGLKKRKKAKRPLTPGKLTHLVLKSSRATGELSFYKHKILVNSILKSLAKKYFIEIKDFVNMGNHLHIKVRFKDVKRFQSFLRLFAGLLARKITNSHRGKSFGKFWDGIAYTRTLFSRVEELGLKIYFEANHRERELGKSARASYLKAWNAYLYKLKRTRPAPA